MEGAHGDSIDPAVFVDDDGSCYYFWGQFHLKGARLTGDMMSLEDNSITDNILTEKAHGFHEGACMRKRNGIYYLLYTDISRGRATCISYATAKSPLGPYTKGGVIVDNTGCDPQTWNNHGSMEEVGGKWYIVYHRSSQNSVFSRRVCVEPISFDEAGAIGEVEMTTQGAGGAICAADTMEAWRACLVHNAWTDAQSYGPDDYQEYLQMYNGSWAGFKYLDFGAGVSAFEATAASHGYGGTLTLHLDAPDGPVIGTLSLGRTGGWQKWETAKCAVSPVTGVHALFITCEGFGSKLLNLLSFRFIKK